MGLLRVCRAVTSLTLACSLLYRRPEVALRRGSELRNSPGTVGHPIPITANLEGCMRELLHPLNRRGEDPCIGLRVAMTWVQARHACQRR
jgi:hypothetical protein